MVWLWIKTNAAPIEAASGLLSVAAVVMMGLLSWRASNQMAKEMASQRRLAVAPYVRFVSRHSLGETDDMGKTLAVVKMSKDEYRPRRSAYVFEAINVGVGPAINLQIVKINGREPEQSDPLEIDGHQREAVVIWTHEPSPSPIIVEAEYYDLLGERHEVPKVKIIYRINAAIVEQLTTRVM